MNSTSIQSRHRNVYEELFRSCTTVVSAPATITWSPTYSVGPGGIGIVSKIPLRLSVGIEPTSTGKLEFGPILYYVPESDSFKSWIPSGLPLYFPLLEQEAKRHGKKVSCRLWAISEIPWYRGLNVDPLIAVPWATAWLLHLGVVSSENIAQVVRCPSDQLPSVQSFDKMFRLACKIESMIAHTLTDGHQIFATIVDSRYPTVFFREPDPYLFDHYRDFGLEHPSSYYNTPDSLFFRGARMEELVQLDQDPTWPIDIALISIGEEGDSQFVYRTKGAFKSQLEEAALFCKNVLSNLVPETFRSIPRFLQLAAPTAVSSPGMNLLQAYRETSVAHSLTVFKTMHDLFQYGAASSTLRAFFDAQNLCQDILRILGLSTLAVDHACMAIRLSRPSENFAARLTGPGIFGAIQAIGPIHHLETPLLEAMQHLQDETGKPVHCHWASWCDGVTADAGVRVEQQVTSGRYSPLTRGQSITVYEWKQRGSPEAILYTADKWLEEKKTFDVIFDDGDGKILIYGEPLTSKHIHSAKHTIELMRHFFRGTHAELKSDELSASCYRSDRNQMESKIVRPIVNLVKERGNKNLGLEIHGGLRSNYSLCFSPDPGLRIGFVAKNPL